MFLSVSNSTLGHPFTIDCLAPNKLAQHLEAEFVEVPQLVVADGVLGTVVFATLNIIHEPVVDGVGFAPLCNRDVHGDIWVVVSDDLGGINRRDDLGVDTALVVRAPLTATDCFLG